MELDRKYLQDQEEIRQGRINNVKSSQREELVWSVQNFYGFSSNSPQQIVNSNVFGSSCINILPEGQIMKKSPGAEAIGLYADIDILGGYKSMFCGSVAVRRQGNYFFNMVQKQDTLESSFYILKDDSKKLNQINGIWLKLNPSLFKSFTGQNGGITPLTSITLPENAFQVSNIRINGTSIPFTNIQHTQNTNVVNLINGQNILPGENYEVIYQANFVDDYKFKGYVFDYVIYKGFLYICSGREDYLDGKGDRSGLLRLDLETRQWEAILTGKSAKLDWGQNATTLNNPATRYDGRDVSLAIHQLEDFNPSIIEEYQDRLVISGSKANPYQIKMSEHLNPRNFVDGVLGATALPADTDDLRRPSVLFADQQIVSLTTFGESLYAGTLDGFIRFDVKQIGQSLVDLKSEDKSTNSGAVSNKSCKVFKGGQFYFASNYQVIPELNVRNIETKFGISGNATVLATPPEKLTFFIDETLKRCDVSNSCVGLYKNYVFWSVAICPEREAIVDEITEEVIRPVDNNTTIVYSKLGDTPIYALLPEIRANWFAEIGGRGLMYSSCDNGNVYLVSEDFKYIDNHQDVPINTDEPYNPEPTEYVSVFQTGIVGFNGKRDSPYTKKLAKTFYFTGGFTNDAIIEIEGFAIEGQCGEQCCQESLFKKTIQLKSNCDIPNCNCDLTPNLNYFNNNRTVTRYFDIPVTASPPVYTSMFVRINIISSDFYINEIGGTYDRLENGFDGSFQICDDEIAEDLAVEGITDTDTGNPIIIEKCTMCKM